MTSRNTTTQKKSNKQLDPQPKPPLDLQTFLKLSGLVETGGEAKFRIQGGEVWLNGQIETRRRKKLAIGDVVRYAGQELTVAHDPNNP